MNTDAIDLPEATATTHKRDDLWLPSPTFVSLVNSFESRV